MRLRKYLVFILISLLLAGSAHARRQEDNNGIAAIKTAWGFLLVWNQPDNYFTLEIRGKNVRAMNSTEHVFFEVDGVVLQIQSVAISEFLKEAKKQKPDVQSILTAHKIWEAQFAEENMGKKLNVQSAPQKLSNGGEALFWKFDMPEGLNQEAKQQLFLTMVNKDYVVLINGVVTAKAEESVVKKLLTDTVLTLKVRSSPINLLELQESIRQGKLP